MCSASERYQFERYRSSVLFRFLFQVFLTLFAYIPIMLAGNFSRCEIEAIRVDVFMKASNAISFSTILCSIERISLIAIRKNFEQDRVANCDGVTEKCTYR